MIELDKSQIDAEERAQMFHESFDVVIDPGATLEELVRAAGDYLSMIVGPEAADAGMAAMIAPLAGKEASRVNWREALEDNASSCFSEWPLGQRLHDLVAYARFGIALTSVSDEAGREKWLGQLVEESVAFRNRSPLALWLPDRQNTQLQLEVMLAENRWALDNNEPIEPAALAGFGLISEGRLRNMMSGANRTFTPDENRKIPAHEALAWLSGRENFWPSIWREQNLTYHSSSRPPVEHPVFVPVARDGSVFHPGLRRGGTYTIGEKSDERHIPDFEEALLELQKMPAPYWRRPNDAGNWGLIGGIRWERLERADLEVFAANPKQRLS